MASGELLAFVLIVFIATVGAVSVANVTSSSTEMSINSTDMLSDNDSSSPPNFSFTNTTTQGRFRIITAHPNIPKKKKDRWYTRLLYISVMGAGAMTVASGVFFLCYLCTKRAKIGG